MTVSTDTQFTHLAWQRDEKELKNVKFQMGADPTGKVARLFGVYLEEEGLALRGAYLIAPDGKLMAAMETFLNVGRNVDELLRMLKANLYLAKKTEEGCPAQWKDEGDATLKPSKDMVGRVHEALRK